jgi:hypothetical protein
MKRNTQTSKPLNEVTALFAASASSLRLSDSATFADLAERLEVLAEWHAGTPGAIYLTPACPDRSKRQRDQYRTELKGTYDA